MDSLVHLNKQLQTNLQHLINEYEGRKYQLTYDDEYCDDLERQLRLTLQHEDVVILHRYFISVIPDSKEV